VAAQTPDAVAPPPGHPRFALIDALRAVAAIGVLASHAGDVSGAVAHKTWYAAFVAQGVTGVTVFFVLSGFLLYRPFLAADLDGLRRVRLRDYARRRLLRILPAYWLALTVIGLWLHLRGVFTHDWWRYYLLLQVYWTHTLGGGLFVAWTLCVEVSFYLYLPFHAMAVARLGRGRPRSTRLRLELTVLAVLALISLGLYYATRSGSLTGLFLTLPVTFAWFALGMALAVVSVGPVVPRAVAFVTAHPARCWALAGAGYVALSEILNGLVFYSPGQWMVQFLLSGVIAVALVAPAALGDRAGGWPRRVLAWRWLGTLGLISYGIYLWQAGWVLRVGTGHLRQLAHGFVGEFVLALAASAFCAAVSYRFLERPLMRFKNPHRRSEPPATRDTTAVPASGRAPVPDSAPGSPR
jgi:peptidoglycan/LPS O-acetylase OafA/YrhL